MKNEFVLAFNEILEERGLPKEVIMEALEAAMVSAYRRAVNASSGQHVEAKIDPETGGVVIFAEKEVVETVQDPRTEVSLEEALEVDPEAEIGSIVIVESTPKNFGRVAAQAARQVIHQRIREAERNAQFEYFSKQIGEIVSGTVQAVNQYEITIGLELKAEGIMPRKEQIPRERFDVRDRVRALVLDVRMTNRGPQIILSRAHRNFLRRLLEIEVPEIYHGMVEVRSIAREPGQRSKVSVSALQPGIDPVGACVGIRGIRIQAIVRELHNEKIDVIEWNPDPAIYIAKALSPARVHAVYLNDSGENVRTATVVVPEDQLSLAIGRDGQNARLAARLTGWRIDIKSLPEAAADALYRLQTDPQFAKFAAEETETIAQAEAIMAKKAEGRPVMPEEYHLLMDLVDRVERGGISIRKAEREAEEQRIAEARAKIPDAAFDMLLDDLGLSPRWTILLTGAGYSTIGDLMLQMELDPDAILALRGLGPKAMADIEAAFSKITFPEVVEEPAPEEEAEVVAAEAPAAEEEEAVEGVVTEAEPAVQDAEVTAEEAEGEVAEPMVAEQVQPEAEVPAAEEPEAAEEAEEEKPSLEELFAMRPEVLGVVDKDLELEEEEEVDLESKKKKRKKRRKFVELEYDPDADVLIARKKRKRESDLDWDEWAI
jgi:N utilization substance protein A